MEKFTPIEFQQARDFSKKLNITFEFIRQNFKSLGKSLLYISGPVVLIGSLLTGSLYSGYLNSITETSQNPNSVLGFVTSTQTWAQGAAAVLFIFMGGIVIVSVVYNYMLEYHARKDNRIEVDAVWNRVKETLPQYLATFFLFFVVVILAYVLIVLLIAGTARLSIGLAIFTGFITIILLIYAIIPLSLIFVVRAFEKVGFIKAIERCFELISGKWWSTFGLLVIVGLVQSMLASVFFIPWYINFIINMMHNLDGGGVYEPSAASQLINNVFLTLYFLSSFLLYALPLIALAFQYFNLVELKESRGLMSRIEQMGNAG
ncbi:MAG: hypothetical protein N2044_02395 [Cyclobacteriaceae bacterium]|nr:hypothetical protein [Cyclobacteriaceae bacterium]MCX7636676.1 hypothetical protein [Cyclobacteriaceae bacterium]MDW8330960.1 hypothetical protein [Cyclobacteriaceae bacterium]